MFGCKNENFHWKIYDIFLIFAQNIDCRCTLEWPWRCGSNEYPQSMFWSKNKKNRYTLYPRIYSDPTISRHLLYRGICISRELSSTAPLVIIYVQGKMSNSHFQQKLCKISRILVSKFIILQNSCRKHVFAQAGYALPIKCPLSTSNIYCFYFLQTAICRLDVRDYVPLLGHVIFLYGNSDIRIFGEPYGTEVTFGTWA